MADDRKIDRARPRTDDGGFSGSLSERLAGELLRFDPGGRPTEVEDSREPGRCRHRPTCDFEECAPAGIFARRLSQAVAIPILHLCISVVWVTLSVSAPLSLPSVPAPPEGLLRQASRTLRPDSAPRFPGSHRARRI